MGINQTCGVDSVHVIQAANIRSTEVRNMKLSQKSDAIIQGKFPFVCSVLRLLPRSPFINVCKRTRLRFLRLKISFFSIAFTILFKQTMSKVTMETREREMT